MRNPGWIGGGGGLGLAIAAAVATTATAGDAGLAGRTARALDGRVVALEAPTGGALALVFLSAECPIANAYSPTLDAIAAADGERARVVGVCVDPDLDDATLAAHADEYGLAFPIVRDRDGALARRLGVTVTPEAVVVDATDAIRYRGRIDDQFVARQKRNATPATHDLAEAIAAVTAGRPVARPWPAAVGCPLPRPAEAYVPTYARDVAPLLRKNCQECHRPGQIGPFPLLTYEQARKRADDLASVAEDRRMPPWKAVAGFGPAFRHDRALSDADVATLVAWAAAGAPEGDPADLPPPAEFADGWALGTPDLVVEIPVEFEVPAAGDDNYRCFVIKNPLPEDAYVVGVEYKPGNPRVVHHILGYVDTSGKARELDDHEAGPGYTCFSGPMVDIAGDLGGWAPGANPDFLPEGVGRVLPKGADIILQVHYHPTGKPETDRSRVALYLAKKGRPIRRAFHWWAAGAVDFTIPADASAYELRGETAPLPVDVQLLALAPHMHMIGRDMTMTATLPDGTELPLIKIDDWDFNWQLQYYLDRPIDLPKGTIVRVVAHYDNTAGNPDNPSKPPRPVKFGEATTDEMCYGFFGMVKKDQDLTRPGQRDDLLNILKKEGRAEGDPVGER